MPRARISLVDDIEPVGGPDRVELSWAELTVSYRFEGAPEAYDLTEWSSRPPRIKAARSSFERALSLVF